MSDRADRVTRIVLTVIGAILLAIGVAGILANTGLYASGFGRRTLLQNPAAIWIGTHSAWFWPVAAAVAVAVALLAIAWLALVISPAPKTRDVSIDGSARTSLRASALRDALTSEIQSYRGVDSARVRVVGDPQDPRLGVKVNLTDDARVAEVRERVEREALAHAREALDAPRMPVVLDLAVSTRSGPRVE